MNGKVNIVMFEPEIPANTGNIARTCAITGCSLHLIKPLGFSINDKMLKRAGLDYWNLLDISYYEDLDDFISQHGDSDIFLSTTKADKFYTDVKYTEDCYIIFGKETAGIPESLHKAYKEGRVKIPMINDPKARSLNLSNSVNIVVFEALRQLGFQEMI